MTRSRWVPAVLAMTVTIAVVCAGCRSGPIVGEPVTSAPSRPRLDAVLGDGGLELSASNVRAGPYLISFRDLRSHRRAGDRVALEFGASGPRVVLVQVPAGTERVGTLYQNDIVWVTVDGVTRSSPGDDSLAVVPTRQYPTPVT